MLRFAMAGTRIDAAAALRRFIVSSAPENERRTLSQLHPAVIGLARPSAVEAYAKHAKTARPDPYGPAVEAA